MLRGEGRSIAWSNETWLRADEPLLIGELKDFADFYNVGIPEGDASSPVTVKLAEEMISEAGKTDVSLKGDDAVITRGEFAFAVDSLLNPFSRPVTLSGEFK